MMQMLEFLQRAKRCGARTAGQPRRALASLFALAMAAPLGACGVNRTLPPPAMAADYHERHPIVLADSTYTLDAFPPSIGATLDTPTALRIHEFAERYRNLGRGPMTVLTPIGGPSGSVTRSGVDSVRAALAASGVRNLYMSTYPATSPELASPIRLVFRGVKAKVANRCGDWPTDLAGASGLEDWKNTSYWNFGCANQTTLAAQIADPRDLVAPRGESPSDIEMRMRAIGNVRKGEQPDTKWSTHAASISSVGGN
jgi:pilus assembly protein CpaD